MDNPKEIWAGLTLLDRQILGADGKSGGKVDDLQFTTDTSGVPNFSIKEGSSDQGSSPHLSAILSGPEAIGDRISGKFGRLINKVYGRFHPAGPSRTQVIPVNSVASVGKVIQLSTPAEPTPSVGFGKWAERVISKIPGSGHE